MKIKLIVVLLILMSGAFLRFYQLGNIPAGIDVDEASQGYDAYSISQTGKDRYGESIPIFLRSFGNYQSPLYTYLTILPVKILGLSVFSTRFVSALFGFLILVFTFLLILNTNLPRKFLIATSAILLLAISPWAILFSRTAVEANLALAVLILSVLLMVLSFKQKWLFPISSFVLALSAYAYPGQRVISILFLGLFVLMFRKYFFKYKKVLIIGIIIFLIALSPQALLINSAGSKSRIDKVQYWSESYFEQNGGNFKNIPLGKYLFLSKKAAAQYIAYFSPNNLFFNADEQVIRSMPDLSIFYPWMVIPLIFGISVFLKKRSDLVIKILLMMLIVSPIPAAVTREPFYSLRALPVFWVITIIISFGLASILEKIRRVYLRYSIVIALIVFSLVLLHSSYFVLLKYERMSSFGFYNIELVNKIDKFAQNKIIVDSTRSNLGIWYIFTKKYDPVKLQQELKQYVQEGYYTSEPDKDYYRIGNIKFKPINFGSDICEGNIIVGDSLSISENQIIEHSLRPMFQIKDVNNKVQFNGFLVNKKTKC